LDLINRNRAARNSTRKTAISAPYTGAVAAPVVVMLTNVSVVIIGLRIEVVAVVILVCVTGE
jgi:hypothetical protein